MYSYKWYQSTVLTDGVDWIATALAKFRDAWAFTDHNDRDLRDTRKKLEEKIRGDVEFAKEYFYYF